MQEIHAVHDDARRGICHPEEKAYCGMSDYALRAYFVEGAGVIDVLVEIWSGGRCVVQGREEGMWSRHEKGEDGEGCHAENVNRASS